MPKDSKNEIRVRIHDRIRRKVRGSEQRPRLAVFRSLNHIYAQVIDDDKGHTVAAASSAERASANLPSASRIASDIAAALRPVA